MSKEFFPRNTKWRQELNQTLTQQALREPYGISAPKSANLCPEAQSQPGMLRTTSLGGLLLQLKTKETQKQKTKTKSPKPLKQKIMKMRRVKKKKNQ